MTYDEWFKGFVGLFEGPRRWQSDGSVNVCCPVHSDSDPSLHVTPNEDEGTVALHCFAECATEDVMTQLGLTMAALYYSPNGSSNGSRPAEPIEYVYRDENGQPNRKVVRLQVGKSKEFPQFRPDGNGGWISGVRGVRLLPYRLPELIAGIEAGETVFVTEGEKDAEALAAAGLVATTNPMGALKWKDELDHWFVGADVTIWADHDEKGVEHAKQVYKHLIGVAKSVRIVVAKHNKKDAAELIGGGYSWNEYVDVTKQVVKPSALLVPEPSDPMGVAKQFVAEHYADDRGRLLLHHRGTFFAWNGTCWPELEKGAVVSQLWQWLDGTVFTKIDRDGNSETVPWQPTEAKIRNVVAALQALAFVSERIEPPAWPDGEPPWPVGHRVVAMENGLLDLTTRQLHSHTPAFFNQFALPFAYGPNAPKPVRWKKFLCQLWPTDQQSIDTLQEIFGYTISGDTDQQKLFEIVGPRRSGKGTINRILQGLLGKENVAAPTISSLGGDFGLQPLLGKPLASISDARLGDRGMARLAAERLLSISGEDAITVNRKNIATWTGRMPTRFFVFSNELPKFEDASGVIASRFVILMLTISFYGREDRKLINKLLPELPGIFNWALDGLDRLNQRGHFVQPKSAESALRQMEDLASPVGAFVRDCCVIDANRRVAKDALWVAWKTWCDDEGHGWGTKNHFVSDLRAVVPTVKVGRPTVNEKRVHVLSGISLHEIQPGDDPDDPDDPDETAQPSGSGEGSDPDGDPDGTGSDPDGRPDDPDGSVTAVRVDLAQPSPRSGSSGSEPGSSAGDERLVLCPHCNEPKKVVSEAAGVTYPYLACGHQVVLGTTDDQVGWD